MDSSWIGPEDGPPSQQSFKRAIMKSAPREFTIEILAPEKQGSNYSYGVRVCPLSISDSRSISSRASNLGEYEIWRRWEDCLYFQNTLETEYEQLSRRKVKVLKRGGKKHEHDSDSIYTQPKAASSFDSLPEGPDPREVVMNVHDIVPALSKRGTLFRPSRATIDQRGAEFAAMMRGLFNPDPDAPVLLRELRNSQVVRDFFAFWRRDKENAEKYGGAKMKHSNRSMSSIVTSDVREHDHPPLPSPPPSAPFPTTPVTPAEALRNFKHQQQQHTPTRDTQSNHYQTHGDSPRLVTTPQPSAGQSVADRRLPVSYTDHYSRPSHPVDHLQRLNEDDTEISSHLSSSQQRPPLPKLPPPRRPADAREPQLHRPRSNSSTLSDHHRNVYPHGAEQHPSLPVRKHDGPSSQSTYSSRSLHSFSSNPSLKSPSSSSFSLATTMSSRFSNMSLNRSSVNSSISGYTHASKSSQQHGDVTYDGDFDYDEDNAVLGPSSPLSPSHRTPLSNIAEDRAAPPSHHHHQGHRASMASIRTEVSAEGVLPPHLREAWGLDDESIMSYPSERSVLSQFRKTSKRDFNHRYSGSSMSSSSSFSSTGERGDTIAIKAMYQDSIIMFRADRSSPLRDIQQRVKERFALHESVPREGTFILAYAPNQSSTSSSHRTQNISSVPSPTSSDNLRVLQNDFDWQAALSTCNSMIRIRVLDPEAFPHYI